MPIYIENELTVYKRTVIFDNDQIKKLPFGESGSELAEIIPTTETLEYSDSPTVIPIPIMCSILVNTIAGSYTNLPNPLSAQLYWGSDASIRIAVPTAKAVELNATGLFVGGLKWLRFPLMDFDNVTLNLRTTLQDNGVFFTIDGDGGIGDTTGLLTGGNVANTMRIDIWYSLLEIPLVE